MKRMELEAAIKSKFEAVLRTELRSTVRNVGYYVANVLDVDGNTARTINVMYFVVNEGTQNESAYWGGAEPKPAPGPPTFADEVQAWLRSKVDVTVGSKIIRMFDQFSADNAQGRALARLTLEDTGTGVLSTVNVALWRVADKFQYKVIT